MFGLSPNETEWPLIAVMSLGIYPIAHPWRIDSLYCYGERWRTRTRRRIGLSFFGSSQREADLVEDLVEPSHACGVSGCGTNVLCLETAHDCTTRSSGDCLTLQVKVKRGRGCVGLGNHTR